MKVHNLNDIKPYYTSIHTLMSFMNKVQVNKYSFFSDDTWFLEEGRNANFMIFDDDNKDILIKERNIYLKFFFKFLTFLYLNRLTHIQPKRSGKRHSFRSSILLFRFLEKNNIFINKKSTFHGASYIDRNLFTYFLTLLNNHEYFEKKEGVFKKLKNSSKGSYLQPLVNWYDISEYLPIFFRLDRDPLLGRSIEDIYPQNEDRVPWKALEPNLAMTILKNAINYYKSNKASLIVLFQNLITSSNNTEKMKRKLNRNEIKVLNSLISSHVLDFSEDCPISYFYKKIKRGSDNIDEVNLFYKSELFNSVRLLISSCIVIILFSTGMRRKEFYSLKRGLIKADNSIGRTYITILLEKTEYDEKGRTVDIPIPSFLVGVLETLEEISELTSKDTSNLFFNYFSDSVGGSKTDYKSDTLIYLYLRRFSTHFNLPCSPRPHEFRKTIAWYMMTKTSNAAMLLKELFSHESLSMTLEYMHSNPLLQRELDELNKEYNDEISEEIAGFAVEGKLASSKGERIIKALNGQRFKGLTSNELFITTKQFFLKQLNEKQNFLFLTKLSYCVRSSSSTYVSPCMKRHQDNEKKMNLIPNPKNCDSLNCMDAVSSPIHLFNLKLEKEKFNKIIEVTKFLGDNEKNRIYILNAKKQLLKLNKVIDKLEA